MVALVACLMYTLTYRLRKRYDILRNERTLNINVRIDYDCYDYTFNLYFKEVDESQSLYL